jgi:hypothetical protein
MMTCTDYDKDWLAMTHEASFQQRVQHKDFFTVIIFQQSILTHSARHGMY